MRTALVVLVASLAMALAGCGSTIKPEGAADSVTDLVSKGIDRLADPAGDQIKILVEVG